jgi:hypothetical protein
MLEGIHVPRTTFSIAILAAGAALLFAAVPAFAADPPTDIAFDGAVTVVFHDPELDPDGIEGAEVTLAVVDLAAPDVIVQEEHGTTDASGVASFTEIARPTDPAVELLLRASVTRDRSYLDPDGCTVDEHLEGFASAAADLEVVMDIGVSDQIERTCPPPPQYFNLQGTAVDPDGAPLAIDFGEAILETPGGREVLAIETSIEGSFSVVVPEATDPDIERTLRVRLFGPEVRKAVDEPEPGCITFYALVGHGTWTLVGDEKPELTAIIAAEEEVGAVCGAVQPPRPPVVPNPTPRPPVAPDPTAPPAAPDTTLPPSDTVDLPATAAGSSPAAALVLLFALSVSAAVTARRFSRRGN